jgi:hypothetical protein
VTGKEIGTPVDVNDVIDSLLQIISAQALQIAKLEALNKKLTRVAEAETKSKGD